MPEDDIYKCKINKMASKYKMAAYSEVLSVMPEGGIYKFKINKVASENKMAHS